MLATSNNRSCKTDKLLVFLHIPKAAGTTLNGIINQQYNRQSLFRFDGINNHHLFTKLPLEKQNKVQLLRGHFAFGVHQFIFRPCTYFTVLRNPIRRVISQYKYIRNNPQHPQSKLLQSITIEEYISREKQALCNQQTNMICGLSTPKDCHFSQRLKIAQDNLDRHFAVVGVTDMFDETLLMLRKEFNWNIPYYIQQNTGKKPNSVKCVSSKTIALIEKYGELDLQLYHQARKNLETKISQQGESFQKELALQKQINSCYQPFGNLYSNLRHIVLKHILKKYK